MELLAGREGMVPLVVGVVGAEQGDVGRAFPFTVLWLARLALPYRASEGEKRRGRRVLLGMCVASALLTASVLLWLHENEGSEWGSYGRTFAHQVRHHQKPHVPPLTAR